MSKKDDTTPEVEVNIEVLNSTTTKAAAALDDRKSKLDFAKQVLAARKADITDEQFATQLVVARVARIVPGISDEVAIAKVAKDRKLDLSSSKVSQYGVALSQLQEAKAPVSEDTFGDWFALAATGGTAKLRKEMVAHLTSDEGSALSQEDKALFIKESALGFNKAARQPAELTVEAVTKFLAKVQEHGWDDTDRKTISDLLFTAGAAMDDQQVESEVVAA